MPRDLAERRMYLRFEKETRESKNHTNKKNKKRDSPKKIFRWYEYGASRFKQIRNRTHGRFYEMQQ